MNEADITDLKQFITATVSQQLASVVQELTAQTQTMSRQLNQKIDERIDEVLDVIGDALEAANDASHEQLKDHEHRIARLESRKTAA